MKENPINITDVKDICQQIADIYRKKMADAGYDTTGELYNFTWVAEWNNSLFQVYFVLPDYFQWAENGRGPGKFPPPNAILKWIQFKRLVPNPGRNGKIPDTRQLVYLISRKIALKGTEGGHLLEKSLDDPVTDKLVDLLVDAITAEFEKEIEKELQRIYD